MDVKGQRSTTVLNQDYLRHPQICWRMWVRNRFSLNEFHSRTKFSVHASNIVGWKLFRVIVCVWLWQCWFATSPTAKSWPSHTIKKPLLWCMNLIRHIIQLRLNMSIDAHFAPIKPDDARYCNIRSIPVFYDSFPSDNVLSKLLLQLQQTHYLSSLLRCQ